MRKRDKIITFILTAFFCCLITGNFIYAQQTIDLTLEKAVDVVMEKSFRVQQLKLGIERTRYNLKARRAGLKSKVYMNLQSPEIEAISDYKWNSTLKKDQIIRQDTRRWQMDLSIRQPVILLGYPTNGYLSLNNRIYKYLQKDNNETDVDYYNRYFIEFEQPLFQPNYLKNDLEQAELDLEREELNYITNVVRMIQFTTFDYYNLFELSYNDLIYSHHSASLDQIAEILNTITQNDSTRSTEKVQVQVELANAKNNIQENRSNIRIEAAQIKQNLRIDYQDSLAVKPDINISPVNVDINHAIELGYTLRPTMRVFDINRRMSEIFLAETSARGALRINLEMTYGLEKKDNRYQELWNEKDNSYSVSIRAYIPIWDWGNRKANIEAQRISIKRTDLSIEENRNEIESDITNAVANLEEYQKRALSLKENVEIAEKLSASGITQFANKLIPTQDILKIIERQKETELSFLNAYIDYKQALINLMVLTHYDFENDISLIDKFGLRQESL